jgi:intein/homing endonuclease
LDNPYSLKGKQPDQRDESISGLAQAGLGVGAVAASGFLPAPGGGRMWDVYLRGIRAAETAFPAAILRTFRISESLSPLETLSEDIVFGQDVLGTKGKYAETLKKMLGDVKSVTFRATDGIFGEVLDETGTVIGEGIHILSGSPKGASIADYYARVIGVNMNIAGIEGAKITDSLSDSLLYNDYIKAKSNLSFDDWVKALPPEQQRKRLIIAARYRSSMNVGSAAFEFGDEAAKVAARTELVTNLMRAHAAAGVGRLNTVLKAPGEIPVIGRAISKIPILSDLPVKPGTATSMTSALIGKAVVIGAAWKGIEYIDYLRAEGNPVAAAAASTIGGAAIGTFLAKKPGLPINLKATAIGAVVGLAAGIAPRFNEGIIPGAATLYSDAQITRAEISEATGLSSAVRKQEDIAPGLGSLGAAVGFAGVGGLTVGFGDYLAFAGKAIKENAETSGELWATLEKAREEHKDNVAKFIWESEAGEKFAKTKLGSVVSKVRHPMALGAIGGLLLWGGLNTATGLLSGNPIAAVPGAGVVGTTETPEELEDIYSGKKEVAIRKGRWWEFGRCIAKNSMIPIGYIGNAKEAQDIKIGDSLISRDGDEAVVINIFTRHHEGQILSFKTRASWVTETKITGNHIVPILTKEGVVEVEAKDLKLGSLVEIPISKLKKDTNFLNTEELIKIGHFLSSTSEVLSAQINWYNKKIQVSNGLPIPKKISLSPELGRLFGYFLAEGNLSYKNDIPNMIETVHAKSERWIVDDIIHIVKKEFNMIPTVRFKKGTKEHHEGCWIVRICNSLLARVFFDLFYNSDREQDKIIPTVFLNAPNEFKEQLIEGYWCGDGHLDGNTKVISSCRKQLLEVVFSILLSLGEYPYLSKFEKNDYRGKHRLRWVPNVKPYFYKKYDGKLFCQICSIEVEEYDDVVYDFEVDQKDHLFVAGTFLVHNSSAYEGGRIEYFRQHNIARLRTRAYQKGLYGSEEERWEYDPLLNPIDAIFGGDDFKYHYERKYMYERPAPLTGTYGEDVPFIGPLIAETFGKMIKPRKAIRPSEWNLGGGEYVEEPVPEPEEIVATEFGGMGKGAPIAPGSAGQIFNQLTYRRREAIGLPGFAEESLQNLFIGRNSPLQNQMTMATMGKETGSEAWLWKHMNIGGALGMSEPIRRFIPRTPSQEETYNPLTNTMPSWMPSDYYANDFMHGNPYDKIKEAEIRLPGAGYCLHPDTKIETINGYVPIKDIQLYDYVATSKFYNLVRRVFSREYQGELICISSYGGINEETKLTPQHEVKVVKTKKCKYHKSADVKRRPCKESEFCKKMCCVDYLNSKIEWIQAKDLEEGDFVLRPISDRSFSSFDLNTSEIIEKNSDLEYIGNNIYQTYRYQNNKKIKNKQIHLEIQDSNELWFFFGLYIAEGSLNRNKVSLTFHKDEQYLVDLISSLFNTSVYDRRNENAKIVDINNKPFKVFIDYTFGKAENKTIPIGINKEQFIQLLSGWIQGDGYRSKESLELSISPKYEKLLDRLIFYCKLYNINYSLTKRKTREEYIFRVLSSSSYEINLLDYKYCIPTNLKSKTSSDFEIDGHRAFKIKSIRTESYSGLVYDLEVIGVHEYCTSFIVHNSALHPEVAGLHPEDYPIIHQAKILSDVAMYSQAYKDTIKKAEAAVTSDEDRAMLEEIKEQVRQKKERKQFSEYRFDSDRTKTETVTVTEVLGPRTIKTKEYGDAAISLEGIGAIKNKEQAMAIINNELGGKIDLVTSTIPNKLVSDRGDIRGVAMIGSTDLGSLLAQEGVAEKGEIRDDLSIARFGFGERLAGKMAETAMHAADTPLEMLTPMSPASKFIRNRSAIEEYAATEAIGTDNAFWNRPIDHFLKPTVNMFKYEYLGMKGIPDDIQNRRDTQEYYDMLEWVKQNRISKQAKLEGRQDLVFSAESKKQGTTFGADVFGMPPLSAMPREDRDYFNEFMNANTDEERSEILRLVPQNQQRIYTSQWMRQEEAAALAREKAGRSLPYDKEVIESVRAARKSEGFGYSRDLEDQWQSETNGGQVPYDDWIREKRAEEYFSNHSLPGADWIGWHPSVDLEDVKLQKVRMEGLDYHDFDLWDKREAALSRKPYINERTISQMDRQASYSDVVTSKINAYSFARLSKDRDSNVQFSDSASYSENSYNIQVKDRRQGLVASAYKEIGL